MGPTQFSEESMEQKANGMTTEDSTSMSESSESAREMQPFNVSSTPHSMAETFSDEPEISLTAKPTSFVHDWLFPPDLPRSVQLFRMENLAVPACYLVVGLLQGLSGPLINVYPLDLGATEAQQATISSLRGLPASFKLIFGFISDTNPVFGYRRKSYMLIGWAIASASMLSLLAFSNNRTPTQQELQSGSGSLDDLPSIPFLSITFLLFGTGFWVADVMADSVVAEKAKLEPEETRGQLQSTCYACRFFGLMVAAPVSTLLYSRKGPAFVIWIMAILPAVMLPLVWTFRELRGGEVRAVKDQCFEIWATVSSRAVWQPMGFVSLFLFFYLFLPNHAFH